MRGKGPESGAEGGGGNPTDAEISVRAIVFFGAGLGVTMIVVCGIVWLLAVRFKGRAEALDPARSPLAEANTPRLPPEPRLQAAPVADMQKLRAEEETILTTYDWIDRPAGIARIPVDRAIDILAEKGLPTPPPAATQAPGPAAQAPRTGAQPSTPPIGQARSGGAKAAEATALYRSAPPSRTSRGSAESAAARSPFKGKSR